jgi:anaerobic magnesium-protoporphyrin IX monomethyl ester cyclase
MILINPQFDRIKKLGIFSRYVPISLPIGIGILAGYLIKNGKKAKIIDDQITPITEEVLAEYVKGLDGPYIFGLSCFTAGIFRGYELARMIKKYYPDSYVVMGGIHPTVLPEEVLACEAVDIVVRREGDETIIALYDILKQRADYQHILGISYKDTNGNIVHNADAPVLKDLNILPPFPYHLFEKHIDRYNLGFILSARGCPYDCFFCSQLRISGRQYRFTDPSRVIDELDLLINKYGQKNISFFDDNFVVNRDRTRELCNLMYERGFHKKAEFECQTRGDAIDEEILGYLKKAGFTTIAFGLETGSERLMKIINKGETVAQNVAAVKLAKKHGFKVMASFILGLPTETKEERKMAYQLAKDLDLDYAKFNNATPYPGTALYDIAVAEGSLNAGPNYENLSACGTFVEGPFNNTPMAYCPKTANEKDLKKDILRANLYFWLQPKKIFKVLSSGGVSGGWLNLPSRWYFKPKEWWGITRLGFRVLGSLLKVFI